MRVAVSSSLLAVIAALTNVNAFTFSPSRTNKQKTSGITTTTLFNNVLTPIPLTQGINGASASTNRKPIVAGNWKLNPATKDEALSLLRGLKDGASSSGNNDSVDVVIFPPLTYLQEAISILQGTGIQVGAQTASHHEKGAYTGEIAPSMLASTGCTHVLLGHSERRTLFNENDESINERLQSCLKEASLTIVLCIGETLQEYEAGLLSSVVDTQLRKGLAGVDAQELQKGRVVIAYEPVWAIGTGLVATPDQAQAAHKCIRKTLLNMYPSTPDVSTSMRIQYGGSVSPDSVGDLMSMPDVDGALVGGASLLADSFTKIIDGSVPVNSAGAGGMPGDYLSTLTGGSQYNPSMPAATATATATAVTNDVSSSQLSFVHAPLSHFDVAKLKSKGPRKNADVGTPHDSTRPLHKVGSMSAGSWWCAAGGWPSPALRATTEIFYVLSGHGCVTDLDGTRNFFGPGDLVILPKGWSGRWDVLEDIHKVWAVTEHPDIDGADTKAVVKPYSSFAPQHMEVFDYAKDNATHGNPISTVGRCFQNDYVWVIVWQCSQGSYPLTVRAENEFIHILEGVMFVTNEDGSSQRCVAGDTLVLPKGWSGHCDVIEPVKQVCVGSV